MTIVLYSNGTGGTLGDELITETELYMSEHIHFVHHSGDNANNGVSRQKPFASLVYALTQVTDCGVIVLLDGHEETISTAQTISLNGVKIVGEGTSEGVPTVRLTSSLTDQAMLTLSGINLTLANIYFPEGGTNSAVSQVSRITVSGIRSMIRGCYVEAGAGDQWAPIKWTSAAHGARLFNTTGISVSTTDQPSTILVMNGATDCELEACTFDGGTTGFAAAVGAFDLSAFGGGSSPERLRCQQMRFLNGAGMNIGDGATGYISISEKSGAVLVQGFSNRLPNGFGQLGDPLLADAELYMSGTPLYVHYGTGDDANSGVDELAPKKTVDGAFAVASGMDIVVLLPGHSEPISSTLVTPLDGVTVIGCGTSGGNPSCKLYRDTAAGDLSVFSTGAVTYLRNIWFDKTASATANARMVRFTSAAYSEMRGCLVTPGLKDTVGLEADATRITIRDTKFESAGTSVTVRPSIGLYMISEGSMADVDVRGCIFSNSVYGFSSFAFSEQEPITRLYVISMTQRMGADADFNSSTTGIVNPETADGSSMVTW
jgi:hypothetical protein